jgi:6-pyruvoyltetrahydropterin/6-carboxytetrahydropterin synthase
MYAISLKRDFIAQHYLIGGDWGAENQKHSHHYQVEVTLEGDSLDRHGYLVDIVDLERNFEALLARYQDCTLNELDEFAGLNPSIEHFSRILCESFATSLQADNIQTVNIKIWENDIAWASYRKILPSS